ncbi:DUF3445 domain-containing protein [Sphingomonas oligophenolica]
MLGFSVEELAMAGRGGGAPRMGLSRVSEAAWLQRDVDRAARAHAFDAHPDAVRVLPGAEAAGREVAALIGVAGGLAEAARATWEDLCILQADGDAYVLTGAAVAFPTDWRVEDKIGQPLAAIHAPIHGYAEQLAAGVDHFFATLAAGPIFGRANWFVVADDAWRYLPTDDPATRFAQVTRENAGQTLYLRCERQTLRRLPDSGAVLFTIGVAVAALDTLSVRVVRRVSAALDTGPAGEHARRAAPYYAPALAAYATLRDDRSIEEAA